MEPTEQIKVDQESQPEQFRKENRQLTANENRITTEI